MDAYFLNDVYFLNDAYCQKDETYCLRDAYCLIVLAGIGGGISSSCILAGTIVTLGIDGSILS